MKFYNRAIYSILIVLIMMIPLISIIINNNNKTNFLDSEDDQVIQLEIEEVNRQPKNAWIRRNITIDEDQPTKWGWVHTRDLFPWCTGQGTYEDPFVIRNVTTTGDEAGYCVQIKTSTVYYWRIENCSFCSQEDDNEIIGGISIEGSSRGIICNNTICDNAGSGIIIWKESDNNTIIGNNISNNGWNGIYNYWGDDNNFTQNIIKDNGNYGMKMDPQGIGTVDDNYIWNNTIGGNTAGNAYCDSSSCYWSKNKFGNDWDDYSGFDEDDDGIGDDPYTDIDGSGTTIDNYPIFDDGFNATQILIDGIATGIDAHNWTWASSRTWCSGSGSQEEPYLIEDLLIDAKKADSGLIIQNSEAFFEVRNCTIIRSKSGDPYAGIVLSNVKNGYFFNVNSSDNLGQGMLVDPTNNTIIKNCHFHNNSKEGIKLTDRCFNITILNNTMKRNTYSGIHLYDRCKNNTISQNLMEENVQYGVRLTIDCGNNTIFNNTIYDNDHAGIRFYDSCNNNTISRNNITYNGHTTETYGIWFENGCKENFIIRNTIVDNNDYGIFIRKSSTGCHNNTISMNNITGHDYDGIYISEGNMRMKIFKNNISSNDRHGIYVMGDEEGDDTDYHQIRNNIVSNNADCGIIIDYSNNNSISNNTISKNKIGIFVDEHCESNRIYNNNFTENSGCGINLTRSTCKYNKIYYNNFSLNGKRNANDNGTSNKWNAATKGNYWDDYGGTDSSPKNGIGDTAYKINGSANARDYFPIWNEGVAGPSDEDAPSLQKFAPSTHALLGKTAPLFNVKISDPNLHKMWYTLNEGVKKFFTQNETFDQTLWNALTNGSVKIEFGANDTFGNAAGIMYTVYVDNLAPSVSLQFPKAGTLHGKVAPYFQFTAADGNLDAKWYVIENHAVEITDTTGQISQSIWNTLTNGSVTIRFNANDTLGNTAFSEVTVRKDIIAPKILNITGMVNNSIYGEDPPSFDLDIDESTVNKIWYIVEGKGPKASYIVLSAKNITICNKTGTIRRDLWNNVSDGEVLITFYVNDTVGNVDTLTMTVQKSTGQGQTPLDDFMAFLTSPAGIVTTVGVAAGTVGAIVLGTKWGDIVASRARKAAAKALKSPLQDKLLKQAQKRGMKQTTKHRAKRKQKRKLGKELEKVIPQISEGVHSDISSTLEYQKSWGSKMNVSITKAITTNAKLNTSSLMGQFGSFKAFAKLKPHQMKEIIKALKKSRQLKAKTVYGKKIGIIKLK